MDFNATASSISTRNSSVRDNLDQLDVSTVSLDATVRTNKLENNSADNPVTLGQHSCDESIESAPITTADLQRDKNSLDVSFVSKMQEDDESDIESAPVEGDAVAGDQIHCPCTLSVKYTGVDMLKCSVCKCLQHAPCMGMLTKEHAPEKGFVCFQCDGIDGQLATNMMFLIDLKEQAKLSFYRLFVAWAYLKHELPNEILNDLPKGDQKFQKKSLVKSNVMYKEGRSFKVNYKKINEVIESHLFANFRADIGHDKENVDNDVQENSQNLMEDLDSMFLLDEPVAKRSKIL